MKALKEDKTNEVLTKIRGGTTDLRRAGVLRAGRTREHLRHGPPQGRRSGSLCHITGEEKFCDEVKQMPIMLGESKANAAWPSSAA